MDATGTGKIWINDEEIQNVGAVRVIARAREITIIELEIGNIKVLEIIADAKVSIQRSFEV